MGKKKSTSTTQNTYAWQEAPQNTASAKHYSAAENYLNNLDYTTPVTQAHGRNINAINEAGNEFFGHNQTAEVSDKIRQGRLFRENTDYGENMSNAVGAQNNAQMQGEFALGGATAPTLVNASSNNQGAQWGTGLYSPAGQFGLDTLGKGLGN